jgi:Zn-dependent protease with chaperone function
MGAVLAGIAALFLAALLVIAVDAAGGWRRVRPASAADGAWARPVTDPLGLDQRGWRIRTVADVLVLVLVLALGLTPLGARFVHLVAPRGDTWHDVAAWLFILAGVTAVAWLPRLWWSRQMRRARPELFRPLGGPRQRLARAAMVAARLLNRVLWAVATVLAIRGGSGAYPGVSLAVVVTAWLPVLMRKGRMAGARRSDRLSDMVSSLPGGPRIPVVSGWPGAVANVKVAGLRRPVIVVAPPIEAMLTDGELRAVLAHEVAHVQHGDLRRRILRRLLIGLCVLAAMVALYGIPPLRSLAGLRGALSVQAGPFLLALWYLVFRVLYAMELRATRAEERAADQGMIALTADPDACAEGVGKLSSLLGVPDAWTLTQRLLIATHPATGERLRLLRDTAPVADRQPRAATAGHKRRRLLTGVLVLAAVIAVGTVPDHRAIAMPADAGKYRVALPPDVDTAPLDTTDSDTAQLDRTSADAAQVRSSVWGSGDIGRFAGAVPVTAVYDQDGGSFLYVWGAYGKLADPSGELSAFWGKFDPFPNENAQQAGPLGGYLQCDDALWTCAWADSSGIVVMSLGPPGENVLGTVLVANASPTEPGLAAVTRSLRAAAEVPAQPGTPGR